MPAARGSLTGSLSALLGSQDVSSTATSRAANAGRPSRTATPATPEVGARIVRKSESPVRRAASNRSEEHTSELQSLRHLVCRLLLEKKKKTTTYNKSQI